MAIATDSFVVSPLFFPGGDIGGLSVFGTVNDLAVSGAQPHAITVAFILEEGLPLGTFDRVLSSIAEAAAATGVSIVAGDTKVVPRGAADGMFVTTTGVGKVLAAAPAGPESLKVGDEIVVTGDIAAHGVAVLCARESLQLDPPPLSDCGSLLAPAMGLIEHFGADLRCMRDATRGGVTAVLHEWSDASKHTLSVVESATPVSASVRGACELLGLDPLHVANEGAMLAVVPANRGDEAVHVLRQNGCPRAARIGCVTHLKAAPVTVIRALGRERPLDAPLGAPLPRIC